MKFIFLTSFLFTSLFANSFLLPFNKFFKGRYVTKEYCAKKNGIYSEDINNLGKRYICEKITNKIQDTPSRHYLDI